MTTKWLALQKEIKKLPTELLEIVRVYAWDEKNDEIYKQWEELIESSNKK